MQEAIDNKILIIYHTLAKRKSKEGKKEAARLYIQGVNIKTNSKETLLSMIYFELKKLNSKINMEGENIDEK